MYSSRSLLKSSKQGHFLPRKNSSFIWPNTCSVAPLSMQLPFRDMLCTTPASSSRLHPPGLLVLPAHVRVQDRPGALGHLGHELVEQLVLLGHVGMQRRGPGDDLLAAEIVDRREVGLAPGLLDSVTSVPIFSHGPSAAKSLPMTSRRSFRPCPCTSCTCGSRSRGGSRS